jgi:deazaflavin-dependent oxidoreductase (nitroreductase family)
MQTKWRLLCRNLSGIELFIELSTEVFTMTEPRVSPTLPNWVKDHLQRYIASNGADGYWWDASLGGGEGKVATLLLTTIGRKSGEPLTMPLIFGKTDTGYAVIASKGGAPAHPAWYLNLEANPNVSVQVKDDKFEARARTAGPKERAAIWKQMVEIYAPYDKYQANTDREIPVVILERR